MQKFVLSVKHFLNIRCKLNLLMDSSIAECTCRCSVGIDPDVPVAFVTFRR